MGIAVVETRGVRNCNPGNIRKGTAWDGLAPLQPDPAFCTFLLPEWGIRALVKLLWAYQDFHDLKTIQGVIDRWAPPSENQTDLYANFVAAHMGVSPMETVNLHDDNVLARAVAAIIAYENGDYSYDPEIIQKAMEMAKV